jgi:hypothetical protein
LEKERQKEEKRIEEERKERQKKHKIDVMASEEKRNNFKLRLK